MQSFVLAEFSQSSLTSRHNKYAKFRFAFLILCLTTFFHPSTPSPFLDFTRVQKHGKDNTKSSPGRLFKTASYHTSCIPCVKFQAPSSSSLSSSRGPQSDNLLPSLFSRLALHQRRSCNCQQEPRQLVGNSCITWLEGYSAGCWVVRRLRQHVFSIL